MKSKEVETWYYKGKEPIKKVFVNAIQLSDEQYDEVEKITNTWPENNWPDMKIPYKLYIKFLRCKHISYSEREENGLINKA